MFQLFVGRFVACLLCLVSLCFFAFCCVYIFGGVLALLISNTHTHRIGRTGRCGKTGVATSFINRECSETLLLDLKHLLKEADQRIPPVLESLNDPTEELGIEEVAGIRGYDI